MIYKWCLGTLKAFLPLLYCTKHMVDIVEPIYKLYKFFGKPNAAAIWANNLCGVPVSLTNKKEYKKPSNLRGNTYDALICFMFNTLSGKLHFIFIIIKHKLSSQDQSSTLS